MFSSADTNNNNNNNNNNNADNALFTPVALKNTQSIKTSTLFHFFEALYKEKTETLKPYQVTKLENIDKNRTAYLVHLKNNATHALFEDKGYKLVERHLTIDERYSANNADLVKNKLSIAHYTEKHLNPASGEEITAHVYFNSQGQIISTQVKPETVLLDQLIEKMIKENAADANNLLSELLHTKATRYIEEKDKAAELELNLQTLSTDLSKLQTKQKYIKTAEQFIMTIANINRLNSDIEQDCRDTIILEILAAFEENNQAVKTHVDNHPTNSPEAEPTIVKTEVDSGKPVKATTKEKTKKEKSKPNLINELAALEKQVKTLQKLDTKNLNDVVSTTQTLEGININFTTLVLTNVISNSVDIIEINNRIIAINKLLPDLPTKLIAYFNAGEVENFKTLYNHIKDKLKPGFILDLIQSLADNDTKEALVDKQIDVCNFLYDNSNLYRTYIILCGKIAYDCDGLIVKPITRVLLKKNINLFSMFLRHGIAVEGACLIYKGKPYSLLRCILYFSAAPAFLKVALEYGAYIDKNETISTGKLVLTKNNKYRMLPTRNRHTRLLEERSNAPHPTDFDNDLNATRDLKWDLTYACYNGHYNLIPILAPISNISSIAVALGIVSCNKAFLKRLIPGSVRPGVFFASNDICLNTKYDLLLQDNRFAKHAGFVLFPAKNSIPDFSPIQLLCEIFQEKLKTLSPGESEKLVHLFNDLAGNKNMDVMVRIYHYTAAMFVIVAKQSPLSIADSKNLLTLNYQIAKLLETSNNITMQNTAVAYYLHVVNLGAVSQHLQTIKTESAYLNILNVSHNKIMLSQYKSSALALKSMLDAQPSTQNNAQNMNTVTRPFLRQFKLKRSNSFNGIETVEVNAKTFEIIHHSLARSRSNSLKHKV